MKGSVRKRGKTYSYYFDIGKDADGKRRKKEKGGFKTKAEAETALREAIAEFESGGKLSIDTNMSVSQYLKFWYEDYVLKHTKIRTQELFEQLIRTHVEPYLGHYLLKNVTSLTLQNHFDAMYERGCSKAVIHNTSTVVRLALGYAVHPYKLVKENEMIHVRLKYKFKEVKKELISKEEVFKVLDFLKHDYPHHYAIYSTGFYTGMRISEVLGLQLDDIDLDEGVIYVRHQALWKDKQLILVDTKTPSSIRDITIGNTLIEVLKEYLKHRDTLNVDSNFLFINSYKNPVSRSNVADIKRRILKYTGVDIKFHDLRRLHGTLLCENNANMKSVQIRLGHDTIKTTFDTYVKKTKNMDIEAMQLFENIVQ